MKPRSFITNFPNPTKRLFVNRTEGEAEKVDRQQLCNIGIACGSCPYLEENYNSQICSKTQRMRLLAQEFPVLHDVVIRDCIPSPLTVGYRRSIKLVINSESTDGKTRVHIGLYRPATHDVIDIGRCPMQADRINEVLAYLRSAIWKNKFSTYDERTRRGLLRHVVIRNSHQNNQILVTLVATASSPLYKPFARKICDQFSYVNGVILHINKDPGNAIFASHLESFDDPNEGMANDILLAGNSYLTDKICGLNLRYSAASFMQVNPDIAEKVYYRMLELAALKGTETVLDLYCGVGPISLLFSQQAAQVIGIEESSSSIKDANLNAQQNNVSNIKFYTGRVESTLPTLEKELLNNKEIVVTLNPSRRGCQKLVLDKIAALKPKTILYMSCNPKTLLRDLDILSKLGYKTLALEPFDMFPRTLHFEVLAHLILQ